MKGLISQTKKHLEKLISRKRIFAILAILTIILVLVKVSSLEKNTEKREVSSHTDSLFESSQEVKTYCFYRQQKATTEAPYSVEEHVQMTFIAGLVTGMKTGTQSGPDMTNGYEGTLSGAVKGDEIEVVYSYTIEGSHQKELEVYEMRSEWLMKKRWPLGELAGVLVPDRTTNPTIVVYNPEPCI